MRKHALHKRAGSLNTSCASQRRRSLSPAGSCLMHFAEFWIVILAFDFGMGVVVPDAHSPNSASVRCVG